jgi:hypothetical protein
MFVDRNILGQVWRAFVNTTVSFRVLCLLVLPFFI